MGKLVDGQWVSGSVVSSDKQGAYNRQPRSFLETISPEHSVFQPESGRYHLYVAYACPWAHRTLITRALKGLENHISVDIVHPDMLENGWSFRKDYPGATGDTLFGSTFLYEIYQRAQTDISTSVTVPILWDKNTKTIVNNESSQIIRILNNGFDSITGNTDNLLPESLKPDIDEINEYVYEHINNGVYRCGFAKTQEAYDDAVNDLFEALDKIEIRLNGEEYLVGGQLTEADVRLLPTLLRFDSVYVGLFKCNVKRIRDYENLSRYTKTFYYMDAVRSTTHFGHIKRHYHFSHESINPYRIIPKGPEEFF